VDVWSDFPTRLEIPGVLVAHCLSHRQITWFTRLICRQYPCAFPSTAYINPGPSSELGWHCRQMCLSATPLKRQTFLSVADMSEMLSRHVGDILLSRPIFRLSASCRETFIPDTLSYIDVGIGTNEVVTTYEDKKIWNVYRLIYSLSDFAAPLKNKAHTYSK